MGMLARTAVLAAMSLGTAPVAGFGQAAPTFPPTLEQAPDAGADAPSAPGAQPPAPGPPLPLGGLPRTGGRNCAHERGPGTGV